MSELKHVAQHAAAHIVKEAAQGAGCMVTLFAMVTGTSLLALVVVLFV